MMAIKSSIFKIHRVLGAFLSILFLMWFVSGVVMMYHTYPKVDKTQALKLTRLSFPLLDYRLRSLRLILSQPLLWTGVQEWRFLLLLLPKGKH